jgi:hypothetical protein
MLAPVADCDVDARGVEISVLVCGLDAQRQVGMAALEVGQRRQQHGAGEERQRRDPELAAAVAALPTHVARSFLQGGQRRRHFREITLALRRQPHRARAADEQLDAELLLQPPDLVADGGRAQRRGHARRDGNLSCGAARSKASSAG